MAKADKAAPFTVECTARSAVRAPREWWRFTLTDGQGCGGGYPSQEAAEKAAKAAMERNAAPKGEVMATEPKPFDLTNPEERTRLLRETVGYAKVGLHYGTDTPGRDFAYQALRDALEQGYTLAPPAAANV